MNPNDSIVHKIFLGIANSRYRTFASSFLQKNIDKSSPAIIDFVVEIGVEGVDELEYRPHVQGAARVQLAHPDP